MAIDQGFPDLGLGKDCVTLCPRVPGRGNRIQTLRPHNKDERDDSPFGAGITERGRACPVREGKRGEEKMNEDEKPEPFKKKTIELTGWVLVKKKVDQPQSSGMITVKPRMLPGVKPRQESQKTERREDIKRRINDELEFLMEMEDRVPRKDEMQPNKYCEGPSI